MRIIHGIRQNKLISRKALVHKPPGWHLVLLLEIERVMIGTAGVEGRLTRRASIGTTQILCDAERNMAIAAVNG
jgi:hypothetical protein